jgi:hypothetical protein
MSTRTETRAAIAAAIEMSGPARGDSELVDILSAESLAAKLAAHKRGERGPVFVVVIPKYAPQGTQGWVYTVDKVNKVTVNLSPVGGGRGLKADPFTLAEADAADLRAYEQIRAAQGDGPAVEVHTGSVVLLSGPGWRQEAGALFVVTGLKGMTEFSAVRLGGDEGRTWPKLPRTLITTVIAPEQLVLAMSADPRFAA